MTCALNWGECRRRLTGILISPGNSIIGAHLDLGGHHRRAQTPGRQDGFTGRLREKFCEGHWNYVLKNGYVKQILERVKHLFQTDTDTSRRIFKAVYLILEKYHRLYGLEAYFFSGGHGPGYVGFQVAAARCFDSGKTDANYDQADISGRTSLVTYLAHIGIPAWSSVSGEQIEGNPKKLGRTRDVERWLESHLTLNQLFSHYEAEISRWRVTYSVEASEKYLLMIRLAGLLARNTGDFPRAPPQCFSDYDPTTPQRVLNIERLLGGLCSRHEIMGINNIFIGSNGLALVNERDTVNVWIHYLEGQNVEQIVSSLESLVDRS